MNEILYKRLARDLNRARCIPGKHREIRGLERLGKVINIAIATLRRRSPSTV